MEKRKEVITIYSWNQPAKYPTDIRSEAYDESGNLVTWHTSSDMKWVPMDMGMVSDWKHHWYDKAFPDGWELRWVKGEPK